MQGDINKIKHHWISGRHTVDASKQNNQYFTDRMGNNAVSSNYTGKKCESRKDLIVFYSMLVFASRSLRMEMAFSMLNRWRKSSSPLSLEKQQGPLTFQFKYSSIFCYFILLFNHILEANSVLFLHYIYLRALVTL